MIGFVISGVLAAALGVVSFMARRVVGRAPVPARTAVAPRAAALAATVALPPAARPAAVPVALMVRQEASVLAWLCAGMLLARLWGIATLPTNINPDEADNLLNIYRILAGHGGGIFALDWSTFPILPLYMDIPFVLAFGKSYVGLRVATAIISVVTLAAFYYLARRWLSVSASLAATTLLGSSAWFMNYSRRGWNVQSLLWASLAMLLLRLALERGVWRWWIAAGAASAMGLYNYFASWMILPAMAAYAPFAVWGAWRARQAQVAAERRAGGSLPSPWRVLVGFGFTAVVALALFLPQAPASYRGLTGPSSRARAVYLFRPGAAEAASPVATLAASARKVIGAYFFMVPPNTNARQIEPGKPIFDPVNGSLLLIGLLLALERRRVGMWWAFLAVPLALTQLITTQTPDVSRGFAAMPAIYLFIGLALDELLPACVWPASQAARAASLALVGVTAAFNLWSYREWMLDPQTARVQEPAVEVADFPAWRTRQLQEVAEGHYGLNVNEWKQIRAAQLPIAAPGAPPGALAQPALPAAQSLALPLPQPIGSSLVIGAGEGEGSLKDPRGVAVAPSGQIYVADTGHARVAVFDAAGKFVGAWGSQGAGDGEFEELTDVAVGKDGQVWALDSGQGRLQCFDARGTFLSRVSDDLAFYHPRAIATDAAGNLYVADTGRNRVVKLSPEGANPVVYGRGPGQPVLDQPTGVAVDPGGRIYVLLPTVQRIQKLSPTGQAERAWEMPGSETVRGPRAVFGAARGRLYFTVPGENRLVSLPTASGAPETWGLQGQGPGELNGAMGLAIDPAGNLLIADSGNDRVQRVALERPGG